MNHDVTIGDNDKYYLYITAQPSRVRHKKVGLENLKTYKLFDHHHHERDHNHYHLKSTILVDKENGGEAAQKAEQGDTVYE